MIYRVMIKRITGYISITQIVFGIKTLTTPNVITDRLMFKVDVNYKDKESVMDVISGMRMWDGENFTLKRKSSRELPNN